MIRECWKCRSKYFKVEGCKHMTCPGEGCGAQMCYICKQPVVGLRHFVGPSDVTARGKICQLFSDTHQLHREEVVRAGAATMADLAARNPNLKLKHDPIKDVRIPFQAPNKVELVDLDEDINEEVVILN